MGKVNQLIYEIILETSMEKEKNKLNYFLYFSWKYY